MKTCEQTAGQTVWEHGISVHEHTKRIISGETDGMRIPDWFLENREKIISNLHTVAVIHNYTLYHDCGKSYCRVVDDNDNGKVHFPDHATVSGATYLSATGDQVVSNLIHYDMAIHTSNAEEIGKLCQEWGVQNSMTLLVVALAEIHSNARLFGGTDTISFKSKIKNWDRRSKQIFKTFFGEVK
jgi:hypothetical protein